jgi:hypothetical protein
LVKGCAADRWILGAGVKLLRAVGHSSPGFRAGCSRDYGISSVPRVIVDRLVIRAAWTVAAAPGGWASDGWAGILPPGVRRVLERRLSSF